jgi:CheY-like chemotaxis protein
MKALLVEDDPDKAKRLEDWMAEIYPGCEVLLVRSFTPALDALLDTKPTFSFMLLDMSMPNFEGSSYHTDGLAPETYAGRDLLAQMRLRSINVPTIVVTMFDTFGEGARRVSIEGLAAELKHDYPDSFRGLIYYSPAQDAWKFALKKLVDRIVK